MSKPKSVLIVSGESSGELYGALLAKELIKLYSTVNIYGIGGKRMEQAGVQLIAPIASAFGITEVFTAVRTIRKTFKKVVDFLNNVRPELCVLIDYPDFNFKVAKKARQLGIRVLYYVSPQVWAWRPKRIYTIEKFVDKIALILPFEKPLYDGLSIQSEFVGHPALDEIRQYLGRKGMDISEITSKDFKQKMKSYMRIDTELLIALLPGSRKNEVTTLLPVMVESAQRIKDTFSMASFIMPIASNLDSVTQGFIESQLRPISDCLTIVKGDSIGALSAADYGIIASGTASFQATILNVPMVVVYKVSMLTYLIGKMLVKVNHIALSNILLDRCYPQDSHVKIMELVQSDVSVENITGELSRLINDYGYRTEMLKSFDRVRELFVNHHASTKVAELVGELLN